MDSDSVESLFSSSFEDCSSLLKTFISKHESMKLFTDLSLETKIDLYNGIYSRIVNPDTPSALVLLYLNTLRILSREKSTLERAVNAEKVQITLNLAGLKTTAYSSTTNFPVMLESLKVVYNMVYQSLVVQTLFLKCGLLECLLGNVKKFRDDSFPSEIKYFTMRTCFIITALCPQICAPIRNELKGLTSMALYLQKVSEQEESFDDQTVDITSEILKVMYTLVHDMKVEQIGMSKDDLKDFTKITRLVRLLLLHPAKSPIKKSEIDSHSIDLLAGVPWQCLSELIVKTDNEIPYKFEGHDMAAIETMVNFLYLRTDGNHKGYSTTEALAPVTLVMTRMAANFPIIRKYMKSRILPPLMKQDLLVRPEIGSTIRNKLCALMTSSGAVSGHVARLLFTLCKESVDRLIKYTGFGNAAGLLANHGLLFGRSGNGAQYSSDSQDSDTEEYKEVRDRVGIHGWIQPDLPPPGDNMTEEQKEIEAIKLVQAIDKLNRAQIIQPCILDSEGKPHAVDHVCQLLEPSESLIRSRQSESSDSE